MRRIPHKVCSTSYKLSKWLVKILTPLVGTISDSHVKNSVDFVNKLLHTNVNYGFKMVSFDVVSLFTKVPVDDLLEFLVDELEAFDLPLPPSKIIELIKLCIKDCKFGFNGNFYSQKFGMAMGNPLSPVLSNLYMEFFETKILARILPPNVYWFRYVDDIFCIWPLSENVNDFLIKLNDLVPSISFTLEEENNCILSFLDVNVHRHINGFKFSIFRKPTNVCSYIHYYSNHQKNVKLSVFSGMFLRAMRICSPEFLEGESDMIYNIAESLKYPKNFIDEAKRKANKTFYSNNVKQPFNLRNILTLPFHENFNYIPRLFKIFDVNVIFNYKSIKNLVIKNSPSNKSGCIYEIPCKTCDEKYYGQTGKDLTLRIKQHKYSVRMGQKF